MPPKGQTLCCLGPPWCCPKPVEPRPSSSALRASGSIMGASGNIMFGPWAAYFPVSLGLGYDIVTICAYCNKSNIHHKIQYSPQVTFPVKSPFPWSHLSWEVTFPGKSPFPGSHLSWRVTSPGKSNFSGKSHKTNVGMSKYPNVRKIPYMLRRYQWLHELNDTDGWTDAEMLQHVDQTASKFAAGKNTIWCFGNTKPTHFESKTNYLKMCFGKYSLFVPFPNYINSK